MWMVSNFTILSQELSSDFLILTFFIIKKIQNLYN
jgi:hypothetical protein